ncbi:two-component regulator propeller domain-containing protein [Lacibacter sp.]|uniref:two-component regulator propeller domain-containing protein n=1 Tax=Lacibacter sp. TaxID=1915409 RepID=UPI002B4AEF03|nr:two-component regulator propeller domain-containing protein [Lacibacter sp.]HLP35475.1 two-component regulator propeller domain-containing protein [Lacibacter sp.]
MCLPSIFLRISCLISTCFLSIYSVAQTPAINFRHIKSENGLSNSTIETILQDNRGFLWFGTRDGLNRYDGSQMIVYRNSSTDSSSISDNYITSLYEDKQHRLWVGTINGLNIFDPKLNRFLRLKQKRNDATSISHNHISVIYGDTKGGIWIGTTGGGANKYQPETKSFKRIACQKTANGLVTELNIYTFFEDSRGNLWAGTESGLYIYNKRSDAFLAIDPQPVQTGKQGIRSIAEDLQGRLLLGTEYHGLIIMHPTQGIVQHYLHKAADPSSIRSNMLRSVSVSKNGETWIGCVNGGLDKFDAATGTFYNYQYEPDNPNSLSQRTVSAFYQDKQGNLWIGTHRGGINLYTPGSEKFNLYRQKPYKNSLSYNDVKAFCEDRLGNIWIGTDGGGLNLFNRKQNSFTHFKHDPFNPSTLGSNEVLDITEDRDGNLWIATWGGGLGLYNRTANNFTRFNSADKRSGILTSDFIQCIFEDKNGNLFIGTYFGGLHLFDKKSQKFSPVQKSKTGATSIIGNNIISIIQDAEGNIWIGTDDGGLNKLNAVTGEFEHYFHQDDKKPDLRVLFTDSKGNLWAGQAGLYLYDKNANRFSVFTEADGLASVFIKGIVEDENGRLWISTSNGLKQLDPKTKTVRTYNTGDGLQDMEFEANAYMKTRDGQIYFGGVNGFNSFYPNDISVNTFVPPVFVTDLQVHNKPVIGGNNELLDQDISFTDKLKLSYKQATFSLGFAALNYVASENNRFVYKLENWDNDWIIAGIEQRASYTNVSPGTYTFTVKASNNDGVWNEKGYSIQVIITPPFWATWWFRLLVIAALVAAGIYIYRIRRKIQLQRYEEEKKEEIHQMQLQFFTNISHEFRTPLSLITGPVEKLLKEDASSTNNHMYRVIQRNANRLLQLINELMDFRKAESGVLKLQVMPGNIPLFIDEIAEEFSELAIQKNISFTVSGTTDFNAVWFDRQVLEKIIINLLSNSFKYTQDYGKIELQVLDSLEKFQPKFENELLIKHNHSTEPFIYFLIADNGTGISKESIPHLFERYYRVSDTHLGSGIGLALIKTLTQLHKGNISVYSEYNKGTEIIIAIPVNKKAYGKKEQWMKNTESPVRLESLATQPILPTAVEASTVSPTDKESNTSKEYLVLVADDHAELRSFLKESLEQQYKIIEAADGKEAMEKTLEHFPDLIISDIMMPVMDGIDYCRLAKTTVETAHIPFILLTAKDGLESRIEGTETGADYYFSKPLSIDLLQLTMRNIFAQKEKLKEHYRKDQYAEVKELAHSSKDKQFLEELLAIIEKNLPNPEMDIDFVCTEIGMSRTKLYNKIKSITGQPIGDFIRTIRLRKAALLMTQGEHSITDIMYSVGIQTQSYFSKAFKQEFGKSPTQYLKEIEANAKS